MTYGQSAFGFEDLEVYKVARKFRKRCLKRKKAES